MKFIFTWEFIQAACVIVSTIAGVIVAVIAVKQYRQIVSITDLPISKLENKSKSKE